MVSGKLCAHILAGDKAIEKWRKLLGPTKVYKYVSLKRPWHWLFFRAQYEQPESIRGRFGLTDTRNAAHGSDSPDSAKREIGVFFPDFDIDEWLKDQEPFFKNGTIKFDPEKCVHAVNT